MPLFVRCTVWSSVLVWNMSALQLQLHINPGLLDSVAATPLLRPAAKPHFDVGKTKLDPLKFSGLEIFIS